jgi:hypothetical protein
VDQGDRPKSFTFQTLYIYYGIGGTRGAARRLAEERKESRDSFTRPAGETKTSTRVFKLFSLEFFFLSI